MNRKKFLIFIFLFFAFSFIGYKKIVKNREKEIFSLNKKFLFLQKEKNKMEKENRILTLQIKSQKDPDWVEMVLMKELGVVPEGKRKVHFFNQND